MTWFADIELIDYHTGPFVAANWSVPLRAIGWLESPNLFNTGVMPESIKQRLRTLVGQARAAYSHYYFRGLMSCTLCLAAGAKSPGPVWSQENIFVPGIDMVYLAPGGIVHYIESHSYLPPEEFIEAVLRCPDLDSEEYGRALSEANGNNVPPLESRNTYERRLDELKTGFARRQIAGND